MLHVAYSGNKSPHGLFSGPSYNTTGWLSMFKTVTILKLPILPSSHACAVMGRASNSGRGYRVIDG